jgi:serine-type D-Ala-D-Ala carboxypeptidase (penicillin-binding protein 5/6)
MNSVLQGGRKKRRRVGARLALLVVVVAPFVVAGAAYLALAHGRDRGGRSSAPVVIPPPPPPPGVGTGPPPPQVRLSGVDAYHLRFHKPPRAALVFDIETGDVLFRRNPVKRVPVASLTKIMTALVVTEHTRPDERVRITRAALRYQGQGIGVLPRGRRVRLETLLNGMMIVSGNDAAIALADHVAGSERRFVRLMNRRARQFRLTCTHFASSHGLEAGNRSCARDLAVLTRLAMAKRRIRRVVRRRQVSFRFPIKGGHLFLVGHNPLFRENYAGAIGLKTGFTDEAGRCFVGVARRHGRTLGVILLHSPNPGKQAARLLDLGFTFARG